jgi:hypothetical protein
MIRRFAPLRGFIGPFRTMALDFYTRLVSGALLPLHERLRKHSSVSLREEMEWFLEWTEAGLV